MVSMNEAVTLAVSFFLIAILGPIGIGYISNATTTTWDPVVVTIFQMLLPVLWVLGVAIKYIPRGK